MRQLLLVVMFVLGLTTRANEPETSDRLPVVSGYIRDAQSGEVLIGATVFNREQNEGSVTNLYGFYSLSVTSGEKVLVFAYLGYKPVEKRINVTSDLTFNIELEAETTSLNEVQIVGNQTNTRIEDPMMGVQKIQANTIREVPALMGEVDAIKVIQLMPGVQAASEGSSGFSVRGGNPDQNMILLDEAIVYNAGHLMGFFSVFNNDAVKDVSLYKGDIPARNGGRLASLLDIRMKDGNSKEFKGTGGIGTIASRLTLEGPVFSDKTTFVISARRTYADLFLKLSTDEQLKNNKLFFYDLNAKISHTFSDKDRVYISGYLGRDVFDNNLSRIDYGNQTLTLRWNHVFSSRLFGNLSYVNSNYDYFLGNTDDDAQSFDWISNMKDHCVKMDFNFYPDSRNSVSFGGQVIFHNILPGWVKGTGSSSMFNEIKLPRSYSREYALYVENTQKLSDRFNVRYGLRISAFQNVGKGTIYSYDDDYEVSDTTYYKNGETIKTYWGLEPRAGITYMITPQMSVKASYSRTYQYLHLASNSTSGTPLDVWFPSSPNVKPQSSDQFSVGIFKQFMNNSFDVGIEGFYKKMKNSIDFKDYADLLLNEYLEGELRFGKSYAYGVEFLTKFNYGRWNGWLSNTWSVSKRKINGINNNNWYFSPYDHTFDCSLVVSYKASSRVTLSGNWIYYTGGAATFPVGRYESGSDLIPIYSDRNSERMPDFHRMDLSCTIRNKEKPGRKWQGEWVFSAYNAYGRKNAWSIYFEQDENNPYRTRAMKTYLFSIVPSITYNFKF